jgi:hypothetical protein
MTVGPAPARGAGLKPPPIPPLPPRPAIADIMLRMTAARQ